MSKTFKGTVSFDFSLILSTESVEDIIRHIQSMLDSYNELDVFQKYVVNLETYDERIIVLWKQAMQTNLKAHLQEVHDDTAAAENGDSFTFSPISIKVEGRV